MFVLVLLLLLIILTLMLMKLILIFDNHVNVDDDYHDFVVFIGVL